MVALWVEQWRGAILEARHEVSAAWVGPGGEARASVGDHRTLTTWRSAAKPFQLEVSLEVLGRCAETLDSADLALGAASHSAQRDHVQRARALGQRLGVTPEDLRCGAHWPVHEPSRVELIRSGETCSAVHNNCSGKHTFMAAAARALGAAGDYRPPEHPLQQRIAARIEQRTGGPLPVAPAVDGCGVPCFGLSVEAMARAWAQLDAAWTTHERGGEGGALGRIAAAMRAEPWWVSGDGRLDLELATAAARPTITKVGAAGLLCGALGGDGGFALKVWSGADAARPVALAALARRWWPDRWPPHAQAPAHVLRNVAGDEAGALIAVWTDA